MSNNYILYGAGELGKNVFSRLKINNISVVAILDKRAKDGESWEGIPILFPDSIQLTKTCKTESFVIVCLNAGMEHYEVAEELYSLGFKRIIFLPMRHVIAHSEKIRLTNLYNRALCGLDVGNEVKDYYFYRKNEWDDNVVIRQEEEKKLVWIGQEILYSEDKGRWQGNISKVNTINAGVDVNLNSYYWYHNLFDYLDGTRDECDAYFSVFGIEPNSKKALSIIEDREKLFSILKKELMNGLEYFLEAAPEIMWNEKGYFNIVGGNHRTIFLQHQGYVSYPVKVSEEDYRTWENKDCLIDTVKYIKENKIKNTYVPVPHPNFINFPYLREEWGNTVLGSVLRYLGPVRLENINVVDASQYEGYFARVAKRMCAENVKFYSDERVTLGLAEKLFSLLHIQDIEIIDETAVLRGACEKADIVFGMLNTLTLLEANCLERFTGKLFSEFWAENETFVEKILKNTKMSKYTVLQRKVFQGKMLEVGVFEV